jgi:hypothetical protein
MTRVSSDQFKIVDGVRVLWNGYDYDNQCWIHEGKRDTRTLEELQATFYHHGGHKPDLSNDADAIAEHVEAGKRAQSFIASL